MKAEFVLDEQVRVEDRNQGGHVRTPWYIRGKRGRVIEVLRPFPDPELLAEGGHGSPYRMLYRVEFRQCEVWPDYEGEPHDTLVLDIYEHWLSKDGQDGPRGADAR
ncbi:MAG: nitrile hydratase subunit beta [Rhizobiaceae bacterium]|nr:nitrile hydratase subunit beta [Rhizobiaceae bacterium]